MLSNDEIQKIIDDIESGAYDIVDVLEAIASAAKGEDVRAALYASVYATKNAQINGQPKVITEAANMKNPDVKYLYLGEEGGYDYGYVYAYIEDEWVKTNLYGEGYSPSVSVTQIPTGVRVSVTDGHGTTTADVENGTATDAQVETYVENWLDEHPEATTTVEDASITMAKLAADVIYAINAGGGGLTADVKVALLDCFAHVAWVDEHGQDYYDALENVLYPDPDLVSISAVFNSGADTIYNTDTLDDLKQYLTVVATYADLHTEIISEYILTGSMNAGTQTITATYSGKTTSFTVNIESWVTSIAAVYTQSGTVYDTDSLDSLKSDLVVTANYADGTTSTVASSDYTLSGTLTVGTSTITVTYLSKMTTFNASITNGFLYLPSKGLLSEQPYITLANSGLERLTESVVDGNLCLAYTKGSTSAGTALYNFANALELTELNNIRYELEFYVTDMGYYATNNTSASGVIELVARKDNNLMHVGMARYGGTSANPRLRIVNGGQSSFAWNSNEITLNAWHTLVCTVINGKMNVSLDETAIVQNANLGSLSAVDSARLGIFGSNTNALDIRIRRFEVAVSG